MKEPLNLTLQGTLEPLRQSGNALIKEAVIACDLASATYADILSFTERARSDATKPELARERLAAQFAESRQTTALKALDRTRADLVDALVSVRRDITTTLQPATPQDAALYTELRAWLAAKKYSPAEVSRLAAQDARIGAAALSAPAAMVGLEEPARELIENTYLTAHFPDLLQKRDSLTAAANAIVTAGQALMSKTEKAVNFAALKADVVSIPGAA